MHHIEFFFLTSNKDSHSLEILKNTRMERMRKKDERYMYNNITRIKKMYLNFIVQPRESIQDII